MESGALTINTKYEWLNPSQYCAREMISAVSNAVLRRCPAAMAVSSARISQSFLYIERFSVGENCCLWVEPVQTWWVLG